MEGKVFQGTLVARFIAMNDVSPDKRDHLYRNCQIRSICSWLEIERRERDSEPLTVHVECFAGNDTRI